MLANIAHLHRRRIPSSRCLAWSHLPLATFQKVFPDHVLRWRLYYSSTGIFRIEPYQLISWSGGIFSLSSFRVPSVSPTFPLERLKFQLSGPAF